VLRLAEAGKDAPGSPRRSGALVLGKRADFHNLTCVLGGRYLFKAPSWALSPGCLSPDIAPMGL
jgi:hypothetical protein